jgi:RTX calcium-binding nonapeptide repeat (4 copies)
VRTGHIPGAAIVLAAILAVPIAGARPDASAPPPKPQPCKGTVGGLLGVSKTGTAQPEPLCGTGGRDTLTAVGGGDTVWGYQGNDQLKARNSKVDLVYGGPGTDAGAFDACDTVYEVETQQAGPPACPGVKARSLAAAGQTAPLPFGSPIIECVQNPEDPAKWRVRFIKQPTMRAVDVSDAVDWQYVAWSPVLFRWDGATWKRYVTHRTWLWDLTYDLQVSAFPGNFWRRFDTNVRTFLWFNVSKPGTYRVSVRYHWYEGDGGEQAADGYFRVKKHYGDFQDPTRRACVFPEPTPPAEPPPPSPPPPPG